MKSIRSNKIIGIRSTIVVLAFALGQFSYADAEKCSQSVSTNGHQVKSNDEVIDSLLREASEKELEAILAEAEKNISKSVSQNALSAYERSIRNLPVLREENRKYLEILRFLEPRRDSTSDRTEKVWLTGITDHYERLLVEGNQRMVLVLAKKFIGSLDILDAISVGNIGLIKAIRKFDVTKKYQGKNGQQGFIQFSTYAHWWIVQSIIRERDNNSWVIRRPVKFELALRKINSVTLRLEETLARAPTFEEISSDIRSQDFKDAELFTVDKIQGVLAQHYTSRSVSEEIESGEGDGDTLSLFDYSDRVFENNPFDEIAVEDGLLSYQEVVIFLNSRHREVLEYRFGLTGREPLTLEEVAKILDITAEGVRRSEARALKELRPYIIMMKNHVGDYQKALHNRRVKLGLIDADTKPVKNEMLMPKEDDPTFQSKKRTKTVQKAYDGPLNFNDSFLFMKKRIEEDGKSSVLRAIIDLKDSPEVVASETQKVLNQYFLHKVDIQLIASLSNTSTEKIREVIVTGVNALKKAQGWD